MEDYREDKGRSYRNIRKNIEELQNRLKSARSEFAKSDIVNEISRLEAERLQDENLFADSDEEESAETESPTEDFPVLNRIWHNYGDVTSQHRDQPNDFLGMVVYMEHFNREYIGFLSPRKLKLDVKYSMVRDTFYNLYSQLARTVEGFLEEAKRIRAGQYTKQYETDILKRMVEMRHSTFVDADRFFRRLRQFAEDLVDDLEESEILCQNGDETLAYTSLDRESELRGLTVRAALGSLFEFAAEAVEFLDVPDFQRR